MKNNLTLLTGIAVLLLFLAATAVANPGISISVDPILDNVQAGQTAKYQVNVEHIGAAGDPDEQVHLYIANPIANWIYTFGENDFVVSPGGQPKSITLDIIVPSGTDAGQYEKFVTGDVTILSNSCDPNCTFQEASSFTTFVNVAIPEFPTMALPVASIIGLVFLLRRRTSNKK